MVVHPFNCKALFLIALLLGFLKVLDAPELQDDFYLNLVDWSSQNVLSVGLGACVYLWSACTSQVTRLCDLTSDSDTGCTLISQLCLICNLNRTGFHQIFN